jgi:hypothetical protein
MQPIAVGIGEDLGQRLDQISGFLAATPTLLELDEVHAPVQHPAVVGQLVLDIPCHLATLAQLVEVQPGQIDELGIENLVDSAS